MRRLTTRLEGRLDWLTRIAGFSGFGQNNNSEHHLYNKPTPQLTWAGGGGNTSSPFSFGNKRKLKYCGWDHPDDSP